MSNSWNRAIDKGFIETVIENCREIKMYHDSKSDSSILADNDYYAQIGRMLAEELFMTYDEDIEI